VRSRARRAPAVPADRSRGRLPKATSKAARQPAKATAQGITLKTSGGGRRPWRGQAPACPQGPEPGRRILTVKGRAKRDRRSRRRHPPLTREGPPVKFAAPRRQLPLPRNQKRPQSRKPSVVRSTPPSALVMTTRLHPVAAHRHRAPPSTIRLAVIDQKERTLNVLTRTKPPRTGTTQLVPREHGPDSRPTLLSNLEGPLDTRRGDHRSATGPGKQRRQHISLRSTAHESLQNVTRLDSGRPLRRRPCATAGQQPVRRQRVLPHPVDDRGGVQQLQQERLITHSNLQPMLDRLQDAMLHCLTNKANQRS